jgi:predicted Holliday junction resolvase-like endonuclease
MNDSALIILFFLLAAVVLLVVIAINNSTKTNQRAGELFEGWKATHLEETISNLRREERLISEKWKSEEELRIRADALNRSDQTHFGKITEHLVPWLADSDFDPRDMRFIGSPVDFLVFEGLSAGKEVTVTFVEVKTGRNPRLSVREERVREALLAKRVDYRLLKIEKPTPLKIEPIVATPIGDVFTRRVRK